MRITHYPMASYNPNEERAVIEIGKHWSKPINPIEVGEHMRGELQDKK